MAWVGLPQYLGELISPGSEGVRIMSSRTASTSFAVCELSRLISDCWSYLGMSPVASCRAWPDRLSSGDMARMAERDVFRSRAFWCTPYDHHAHSPGPPVSHLGTMRSSTLLACPLGKTTSHANIVSRMRPRLTAMNNRLATLHL